MDTIQNQIDQLKKWKEEKLKMGKQPGESMSEFKVFISSIQDDINQLELKMKDETVGIPPPTDRESDYNDHWPTFREYRPWN